MYKSLMLLCFVLAFSKAQVQMVTPYGSSVYNSSVLHTEAYITLSRQQHEKNIQDYNNQIDIFKQTYAAGLRVNEIQGGMLIENLTQTNERLTRLEALSEISQKYVNIYRNTIPTVYETKASINNCISTAQNQINSMLYSPLTSKTFLENYYENVYEKNIKNCKSKFNTNYYYLNYTMCVVDATNAAKDYTINNQKLFASQMVTSRCSADANIKTALDCNYSVQSRTISQVTEANIMINECLLGQDDSKQCSIGYSCPYFSFMDRANVSYYSKTMPNLFYGQSNVNDCLMLKLY